MNPKPGTQEKEKSGMGKIQKITAVLLLDSQVKF